MPFLHVNGIKLYYEQSGNGQELCLIGGYATNRLLWQPLLPYLQGYRITIIENRGAGESDSPPAPYSIGEMADDIALSLRALDIDKAIIFGHSMGGAIAQELAISHPTLVSTLILCSTSPCFSAAAKTHISAMRRLLEAGTDPALTILLTLPWLYSNNFLSSEKLRDAVIQERLANPYPQSKVGNLGQLQAILSFDARTHLHQIRCPTHIISGEEDLYCPLADEQLLHHSIQDSTLTLIPRMGHLPITEIPEFIGNYVRRWIP
jgi:pimeloyl-ACP methyl ester carboxylesterase